MPISVALKMAHLGKCDVLPVNRQRQIVGDTPETSSGSEDVYALILMRVGRG